MVDTFALRWGDAYIMGKLYGTGKYAGTYKGTDLSGTEQLHYNALKKIYPLNNVGGVFDDDLMVEGSALDECYYQAIALYYEFFADTAIATIEDWMRVFGISETSEPNNSVVAAWRAIVNKDGRLTKQYYLSICDSFGFTSDIHERITDCFRVGMGYFPWFGSPIDIIGSTVTGTSAAPWEWEIISNAGPTNSNVRAQFESLINRLKPAWTTVSFTYDY